MKRPQSHRENFPFLSDEDYFRPITPDEFERKANAYYGNDDSVSPLVVVLVVVLVLLIVGVAA